MTKLKSKKLTKSTFAIIIMAIVMVAMIAFGGTYAYFTASTTQDSQKLNTGFLKLKSNNTIQTIALTNVFPSQEILPKADITSNKGIILSVKTNDDNGNYVAIRVKFDVYDYNGNLITMPYHDTDYNKTIDAGEKVQSNNWDSNNNGYLDPYHATENPNGDTAIPAPDMSDEAYEYTVYNDTTSTAADDQGKPTDKGGEYSETSTTLTTTAPDKNSLSEFDYYHTMISYNKAMKKYRDHKKIYDAEKSIANMLTSLNADNMILNTTALNFDGDTSKTGYYWRNLKYKGAEATASKVSNVYVCVSTDTDMEPVQVAVDNKLQAVGVDTYAKGSKGTEIKLMVNHEKFSIPADITDNWDEDYDADREDAQAGPGTLGDADTEKDYYSQHSEAGLMNGTIVISFQAVSIQATGLLESDTINGVSGFQVAQDKLYELLESKWEEKDVPGIGTTPDHGTDW